MDCNCGIRGDDSDVDIETITDTPGSVDMPGHSIQNISSASAPISTKPLERYQNMVPENEVPSPIARSYRMIKTPSGKSGKISVRQTSSLNPQTENSAARCCIVLGQEPKLLSDNKFIKVQSPFKYTRVHNSVTCDIFAATSPATVRSTVLARHTYIRNPAIRSIDKEGSYHHYLHRRIKQLISLMPTYVQNVDRELRLYSFAMDSFNREFRPEITLLKSKVGSNDFDSKFKLLNSKIESCKKDCSRRNCEIHSKLNSYANDLHKKVTLLNSKIASHAHDLEMQITLLNSKINSYVDDLRRKMLPVISKYTEFFDYLDREYEPLCESVV